MKERVKKEHRPVFDLLKGLSDNLNQLTRLAHAKGIERLEKQIAPVLQEVRRLLKDLRDDR
ncbi:plasmid mobilization relaxosome protein MobC [Alistipes shahii]|mgnify:FL=1|uniref:plasmid mobilization relaxosome protein MobC n=1 Tax=Alistipes shahii TaxID=328814 RepID=UPI0026DC3E9C|nr:plasmid mobilization relaxosome protein MobC [Alistipes shahii]